MDPESLLERIKSQAEQNSHEEGVLVNELLKEFHRGYPLENLRPFLRSENERLVNTGVWIASELGEKGKPLIGDVSPLLKHSLKTVRFFAIDCILLWAGPSENIDLASVMLLMDDPEAAVRWKAMDFLSRASREQLRAALSYLEGNQPRSKHIRGLRWLLSPEAGNPEDVRTTLRSHDALIRKYGVVGAARVSKSNSKPLLFASSIQDPDVKDFADSHLRLL